MYTKEEAKTKWCPMVHVRNYMFAPQNYEQQAIELLESKGRDSKCLASDCMMWRWECIVNHEKVGYCGLGGGF